MGLGPGFFWAAEHLPHPPCASKPLPYKVLIMVTHMQAKAFAGTRGGGGNDILKMFSDSYIS